MPQLSESHLNLARQLIESSGIARGFDGAIPDIALRIRQNFANSRPEILKDMDDTLVALIPEVRTRRGELIERTARQIGGLYTEAELREINTFFNSPSGRKYVNAQPQMMEVVMGGMQPGWRRPPSSSLTASVRKCGRRATPSDRSVGRGGCALFGKGVGVPCVKSTCS